MIARILPESPEGYVMQISEGQVSISSRSEAGLFYGCQTLLQLLEDASDQQIPVPACVITDYPGVAYRAVHWDLKYHLDTHRYYYDMIDRLARIKVNAIIVEFEDKIRYIKEPEVSASPRDFDTGICRHQPVRQRATHRNKPAGPGARTRLIYIETRTLQAAKGQSCG